jgi:hypothetical protein
MNLSGSRVRNNYVTFQKCILRPVRNLSTAKGCKTVPILAPLAYFPCDFGCLSIFSKLYLFFNKLKISSIIVFCDMFLLLEHFRLVNLLPIPEALDKHWIYVLKTSHIKYSPSFVLLSVGSYRPEI